MSMDIDIRKRLGEFELNVSLHTDSRRIGILGVSGAGKSMLLKCIAGIERPDCGEIVIDGRTLYSSKARISLKPQERKAGYMFQSYALFPSMTVEENIAIVLKKGKSKSERAAKTAELVKKFGLGGLERHKPAELSGGQAQRAALARLMASEPRIIMLDEAFSALDSALKERLQSEMLRFMDGYDGIVIDVSHDRDEVYKFCDYTAVMDAGAVSSAAATRELFKNPRTAAAARLTGCRNISAARKIDEYRLYAEDWGCELAVNERIGEEISAVGIRAHDLLPCPDLSTENAVSITGARIMEEPFETTYILGCEKGELYYKRARQDHSRESERDIPSAVALPKEKLILLRDKKKIHLTSGEFCSTI